MDSFENLPKSDDGGPSSEVIQRGLLLWATGIAKETVNHQFVKTAAAHQANRGVSRPWTAICLDDRGPVEEDEEAFIDPSDRDNGSSDCCLDYEEYLQMLFDREIGSGFKRDEGVDPGSGFGRLASLTYITSWQDYPRSLHRARSRPKVSRA
ncbi:hypothetical protein NL676_012057 [Syzygium grande]|nr:hypothetical protein NL676_012057 [Syzygium grande]